MQATCPPALTLHVTCPLCTAPSMASTVAYFMSIITKRGSQRDPLYPQIEDIGDPFVLDYRQNQRVANRIMQQSFIVCMQAHSRLWEQFFGNSLKAMRKILIRPILKVMETSLNSPDMWVRKPDCLLSPYIWHKLKQKGNKACLTSVGKQGT